MEDLRRRALGTVIRQEDDQLQIEQDGDQRTLRMVGFPPGFRLETGSRVSLTDLPEGPAARPLVQSFDVELSAEQLEEGEFEVAGQKLALQESTVRADLEGGSDYKGGEREYTLWVLERDEKRCEGPQQVIAVRPARDR